MSEADVVIVGAGPAGLAAALSLADSGLTVAHVEARQRIGGRTSTLNIGRHGGVDVGAHWMHAPRINPLAKAARRLGVELLTADRWPIVIDGDEILGSWGQMKLWRAWRKIDRGIVRLADDHPGAAASLAVDRSDRWQILAGELHGTHACGISLSEVSVEDFANAVDSEDRFVAGGYGALVERAAAGVAPRLGVTVRAIHETATGVRVETDAGDIAARAVLVTVPTTLLASETIRFAPGLPETHREALQDLPHGAYERLVFTLGDDPFTEERDRAVILLNDQNKSFYMLAGGGGPGVHFADFGGQRRGSWRPPASTPWPRWWRTGSTCRSAQPSPAASSRCMRAPGAAIRCRWAAGLWPGRAAPTRGWCCERPSRGESGSRARRRASSSGARWAGLARGSAGCWRNPPLPRGRARPPGLGDVLSRRERLAARARPAI